jgi:hypothetical protein
METLSVRIQPKLGGCSQERDRIATRHRSETKIAKIGNLQYYLPDAIVPVRG